MGGPAMDKSKIEHLNKQDYTHLPHAEQEFENHEQTDVSIRPLVATLAAIGIVLLVSYVGLAGLFQLFKMQTTSEGKNPRMTQVESPNVRKVPEGFPELQGVPAPEANPNTPAQDMDKLRDRNALILSGREAMRPGMQPGMPIGQAMDQAMSRGIFKTRPTSGQGSPAQAGSGGGNTAAGQKR